MGEKISEFSLVNEDVSENEIKKGIHFNGK